MNAFEALYCRSFQTCFKIALPLLPYRNPKCLRSVREIPAQLAKLGVHSVIIVTDAMLTKLGLTDRLTDALSGGNIDYCIYDGTVPNPTVQNVEEALTLYHSRQCRAIIAIGGGSSIDCAKALGVRVVLPKKSLKDVGGILKVHRPLPPLFAIPTTAGTGSETTLAAVISNPARQDKYAIMSFPLIPDYAVLDPEMTRTLPPRTTAETGIDAFCHALEAYLGRETTHGTRVDALMAMRIISENIETVYSDGNNMKARRNMLVGSYYAGCAFTRSYVGYVHAIAHSIGGAYNLPHGRAIAITLPYVLRAYGPAIYGKLKKIAVYLCLAREDTPASVAAKRFLRYLDSLLKRFDIPGTIPELKAEDIPMLAAHAAKEANPLYPVPVLFSAKELEEIMKQLLTN